MNEARSNASSPAWHTLPVDVVLSDLSSTPQGLAEADVEHRLARYGPN
ncbi:MAG: hypothetical protein JRJ24_21495, partial [Deltaproteobacteria bacterium]|nr:hypothetical protein [Deltaproteobacteria bacterium]MBW1907807.1 hypothetical protein [Deltaproteobacteria bacterium]